MGKLFWLVTGLLAMGAGLALAPRPARDLLLFNPSPSIKVGLYLRIAGPPRIGDAVTVRAREVSPTEARLRHFAGPRDRFIKHVAAAGGDMICAQSGIVSINGKNAAEQRERDGAGRVLVRWQGCRLLKAGEYFLLGESAGSFDSRYWGPVRGSQIEGVWRLL